MTSENRYKAILGLTKKAQSITGYQNPYVYTSPGYRDFNTAAAEGVGNTLLNTYTGAAHMGGGICNGIGELAKQLGILAAIPTYGYYLPKAIIEDIKKYPNKWTRDRLLTLKQCKRLKGLLYNAAIDTGKFGRSVYNGIGQLGGPCSINAMQNGIADALYRERQNYRERNNLDPDSIGEKGLRIAERAGESLSFVSPFSKMPGVCKGIKLPALKAPTRAQKVLPYAAAVLDSSVGGSVFSDGYNTPSDDSN